MFERLYSGLAKSLLIWHVALTLFVFHFTSFIQALLAYGSPNNLQQPQVGWPLYIIVAVIWVISFSLLAPHRALFSVSLLRSTLRLLGAAVLAALIFGGVLFLLLAEISRLHFLYFVSMDLLALLLFHLAVYTYILARKQYGRQQRVLLVGRKEQLQDLARHFSNRPQVGIHIVGCATVDGLDSVDLPVLGTIAQAARVVRDHSIDEVIFVATRQEEIMIITRALLDYPVRFHQVPTMVDMSLKRTSFEIIGGLPLIALRQSALSQPQQLIKRTFDILASAALLVIFSPIMLLIAAMIRLDSPGPVFFFQERIGEGCRRFKMIKFRTMHTDAERRWREVAQRDEQGRLIHKLKDDPRVTQIGRKLRSTSLDELPQLINVLRGDMSLVGPRPEMPYMAAQYQSWQWQRVRVPPGITGWWQINGRSDKPMHLNTDQDLFYIQNYSFWLDLRILMRTIGVVLKGHGAF